VQVKAFDITQVDFPVVHFRIICSKGTYIRSLVRDFGNTCNRVLIWLNFAESGSVSLM
jgi:tRNA pseudouridine55 synthase